MNIKRLVQFFLIFIIILISYLFYKNYFYEEQNVKVDTEIQNIEENILSSEKTSNIIENFEYEANDKDGNSYIVKAEKAEIQKDYTEILILTNVRSIIYIENRKEILIFSDFAEFNKENYDTKFSDNVKILSDYKNDPVLVRNDLHLAATFHPETSNDLDIHKYFIGMINE